MHGSTADGGSGDAPTRRTGLARLIATSLGLNEGSWEVPVPEQTCPKTGDPRRMRVPGTVSLRQDGALGCDLAWSCSERNTADHSPMLLPTFVCSKHHILVRGGAPGPLHPILQVQASVQLFPHSQQARASLRRDIVIRSVPTLACSPYRAHPLISLILHL